MNPLVTISIPVYKCEETIIDCLESVKAQTYDNIEVILVNDCSPDQSALLSQKFIQNHNLKNWRIIDLDSNRGLSVVRNIGIENAKGKYLFFLDSDDTISKDTITEMVDLAERENVQMVIGETISITLPTQKIADIFPITVSEDKLVGNDKIFEAFTKGKYPESSWNKLILTSFLRENHLYFTEGLYAQDSLHSFEVALKIDSIAILRKKTYQYYLHDKSVIHNRGKKHFDNWFTIATKIDQFYKEEQNFEKRRLILEYLLKYKVNTLMMNWKAKADKELWLESYRNYQTLSTFTLKDFISNYYSTDLKRKVLYIMLPPDWGFKFFKWRYER